MYGTVQHSTSNNTNTTPVMFCSPSIHPSARTLQPISTKPNVKKYKNNVLTKTTKTSFQAPSPAPLTHLCEALVKRMSGYKQHILKTKQETGEEWKSYSN